MAKQPGRGARLWALDDIAAATGGIQDVRRSLAWRSLDGVGSSANFGYTRSAHWFRIQIDSRYTAHSGFVIVENAFVDSMTLYWPERGDSYLTSRSGASIPVSRRSFPHRYPAIRFGSVPPGCSFAYLRLETSDVAAYPIRIYSDAGFWHLDHDEQLLAGAYYGLLAVMLVFNVFVFMFLHDAMYLEYSMFIASFAGFQAVCNGFAAEYLWPEQSTWNHFAVPITCGLATFFGVGFAAAFMGIRRGPPHLMSAVRFSRGLSVALLPASLLPPRLSGGLGSLVASVGALVALAIGIVGLARRYRPALLYMIAAAVLMAGVLLNALRNFGLLADHPVTAHSHQVGAALLVVILTLALLARFASLRREKERALAESLRSREDARRSLRLSMQFKQQALQAKIKPHFLFNTLNTIHGSIAEDPVRGSQIVEELSHLFRYTLAATECDRVPLRDEIEIVRSYLEIERARFGQRVQFQIETTGDINVPMIPGLTIQPLVENSIKHGLSPKIEGGTVVVQVEVRTDECRIVVTDDGVGMNCCSEGRGHGLANVRERLRLAYADRFVMNISTNQGTRVEIRLPL